MNKRYLIFSRSAHSVVYFVQAPSPVQAIRQFIAEENEEAVLKPDGLVEEAGRSYPHPLAYIEAHYKTCGEWQMRELPDWVWRDGVVEAFCGESEDGPASVIADCRVHFAREFPRRRASAFVWYLKEGTLVTFYQKKTAQEITVLRRYFWDWTGKELIVRPWGGSYEDILAALLLEPARLTSAGNPSGAA